MHDVGVGDIYEKTFTVNFTILSSRGEKQTSLFMEDVPGKKSPTCTVWVFVTYTIPFYFCPTFYNIVQIKREWLYF